jgi:hypothetical protein
MNSMESTTRNIHFVHTKISKQIVPYLKLKMPSLLQSEPYVWKISYKYNKK